MTLGSMRRYGVRGLFVTCQHCSHERSTHALQPLGQAWCDGCAELDRTGRQIIGRREAMMLSRRQSRRIGSV
jgi:hypothetical protein